MKKLLLSLSLVALMPLCATAQEEVTVNVETAGQLKELIDSTQYNTIKRLIVTGTINGTDIGVIRTMAGNGTDGYSTDGQLSYLNLSGVKIVRGGDVYYNDPAAYDQYSQTFNDAIGMNAFWECKALEEVVLPEGITRIQTDAFSRCENLKKINIPSTVTRFGSAFYHCHSLESITIPEGIDEIEELTFSNCRALTSITIPQSVETVGAASMRECLSLTDIVFPDGVKTIDNYALAYNTGLKSATLGAGLTKLGDGVFQGCTALESLTALATTPSAVGDDPFYNVDKETCILYVPAESLDLYKVADGYKDFLNIRPLATGVSELSAEPAVEVVARYTIDGRAADASTQGLVIERLSNGTARKVMR